MNTEAARTFMKAALMGSETLPGDFHKAAYKMAVTAKDTSFIEELIGRVDAPEDLVETYKNLEKSNYRIAYLRRKNLTTEEIVKLMEGETRAGVLGAVLKSGDFDESVHKAVEESFMKKPTKILASLLISLSKDPDVLIKSLNVLSASMNVSNVLNEACVSASFKLITKDHDLALKRLRELNSPVAMRAIFRNVTLNSEEFCEFAVKYVSTSGNTDFYNHYYARNEEDNETALHVKLNEFVEDENVYKLLKSLDEKTIFHAYKRVISDFLETSIFNPNSALNYNRDSEVSRRIASFRNSDVNVLTELYNDFFKEKSVAEGLLLNEAFPKNLLKEFIPKTVAHARYYGNTTVTEVTVSAAVLIELAKRNKGNDEILDLLYVKHQDLMLVNFGYSLYEDESKAQTRLFIKALQHYEETLHEISRWSISTSFESLLNHKGTDLNIAFKYVPFPYLKVRRYHDTKLNRVWEFITAKQVEILKDDFNAWETFAVLAETFEGSIEELLECASELS